jgi:hypothetical protein
LDPELQVGGLDADQVEVRQACLDLKDRIGTIYYDYWTRTCEGRQPFDVDFPNPENLIIRGNEIAEDYHSQFLEFIDSNPISFIDFNL